MLPAAPTKNAMRLTLCEERQQFISIGNFRTRAELGRGFCNWKPTSGQNPASAYQKRGTSHFLAPPTPKATQVHNAKRKVFLVKGWAEKNCSRSHAKRFELFKALRFGAGHKRQSWLKGNANWAHPSITTQNRRPKPWHGLLPGNVYKRITRTVYWCGGFALLKGPKTKSWLLNAKKNGQRKILHPLTKHGKWDAATKSLNTWLQLTDVNFKKALRKKNIF